MKLRLVLFETKSSSWVIEAREEWREKISHFFPLEVQILKSPSADRDQAENKREKEAEALVKVLNPDDFLILFTENGKTFSDSEALAKSLSGILGMGKKRITWVIGGPYGFASSVEKLAQAKWSLSTLTMNHFVAQIVALEQIYRAFMILNNRRYHNR